MKIPKPKIITVSFPHEDKELLAALKKESVKRKIGVSQLIREKLYQLKGGGE